jgi:hypothetical protein
MGPAVKYEHQVIQVKYLLRCPVVPRCMLVLC